MRMSTWRKLIINYKSTSWLLVAAIIAITLLPAHYHLHHLFNTDSTAHDHVIDLHVMSDKAEHSHHDEGTEIISATPDGFVEKASTAFPPFILLAILLLLLPRLNYRISARLNYRDINLRQTYFHLSPPLRAPPLI